MNNIKKILIELDCESRFNNAKSYSEIFAILNSILFVYSKRQGISYQEIPASALDDILKSLPNKYQFFISCAIMDCKIIDYSYDEYINSSLFPITHKVIYDTLQNAQYVLNNINVWEKLKIKYIKRVNVKSLLNIINLLLELLLLPRISYFLWEKKMCQVNHINLNEKFSYSSSSDTIDANSLYFDNEYEIEKSIDNLLKIYQLIEKNKKEK